MVYTLKTNRRPIATAREMDVGLDEVGDSGRRDGMERRGGRARQGTQDEGGREGGMGSVGQESESCHKNDNNKKPQCHPVTTSRLV